jgi:hypothetical protein
LGIISIFWGFAYSPDSSKMPINSSNQLPNSTQSFSAQDYISSRLEIVKTLASLPSPKFQEFLFVVNPPLEVISPNTAPQLEQAVELLKWLEKLNPSIFKEIDSIIASVIS